MGDSNHENDSKAIQDFGHIASGVGHHVINGFAAIVSNAEIFRLALANRSDVNREAIATTIIKAALDASVVARRMIDYSRTHTNPGDSRVVLSDLIVEYVSQRVAAAGPLELFSSDIVAVPPIHGNADHLREMLDLLTINAIESGRPDRQLRVNYKVAFDNRNWLVLEVSDNGAGMDLTALERAIEPFFSTKPGRLGVGLTIANGIWRRHRGTLSIRSSPGQGTTIRLCIDPTGPDLPFTRKPSRPTVVWPPKSPDKPPEQP